MAPRHKDNPRAAVGRRHALPKKRDFFSSLPSYCTAIVAVLLVTVPSADFTTRETAFPLGALGGTVTLI